MSVNLIIDDIYNYVSDSLTLYSDMDIDVFKTDDGSRIMLRNLPSNAEQGIDFKGNRYGGYTFEIWARSLNDVEAKTQLIEIERLFGVERQIELTDYTSIQVKRVANAALAEITEQNEYVYVSQLEIEYIAEGGN